MDLLHTERTWRKVRPDLLPIEHKDTACLEICANGCTHSFLACKTDGTLQNHTIPVDTLCDMFNGEIEKADEPVLQLLRKQTVDATCSNTVPIAVPRKPCDVRSIHSQPRGLI